MRSLKNLILSDCLLVSFTYPMGTGWQSLTVIVTLNKYLLTNICRLSERIFFFLMLSF